MKRKMLMKALLFILIAAAAAYSAYEIFRSSIPDDLSVDVEQIEVSTPGYPLLVIKGCTEQDSSACGSEKAPAMGNAVVKMLGIIPIKNITLRKTPDLMLVPCGFAFGVKLYTEGVMVVGLSDILTEGGLADPAYSAGIRPKDIILEVDGLKVNRVEELSQIIKSSQGKKLRIVFKRGSERHEAYLEPVVSKNDGNYKAGMWVRDSTAGIGTMTFYDPQTGIFAGLGHGICDVDTGQLMPLMKGVIVKAFISGIRKGAKGSPGELKGYFDEDEIVGSLYGNDETGVWGICSDETAIDGEPIPADMNLSAVEGSAYIYTTIDGKNVDRYQIEILKVYRSGTAATTKNMLIQVTDSRLIEATGGIVQGMSGSPIVQNGKIIGAVTHVLVNDPTKGFGIFIKNIINGIDVIENAG